MEQQFPIQMPERVVIEETDNLAHGKFIMQPLEEGYGVTLGNALRRVILSSVPGCAFVAVKISGVLHEFQTIPGVQEDVCEIILNLKGVRFRLLNPETTSLSFTLKGAKNWTAQDIQNACPEIEVLSPSHFIATLAEDAEFEVELRIGQGRGYVSSEDHQLGELPIGMIPIDAIYTPIKNVIYNVEPQRVGQKTDYDRLSLDVTTDGSISAKDAVQLAANILLDHIEMFISVDVVRHRVPAEKPQKSNGEDEIKEAERAKLRRLLLTPVDELELSVRANNCLKAANIKILAELVKLQEPDLLKFRNFGRKSLSEISDVVKIMNLTFGMDVEKILRETPKQA